jgi:hypothetical protein
MANKLKITKTPSGGGQIVDAYVSQTQIDGAHYGGTGGLTSQPGKQIQAQVYLTGGSSVAGSVLAQKGAHKFQVTDGTRTGKCTLVNSPNLSAGQMNILIILNNTTAAIAAANVGPSGATSTTVTFSSTTGPVSLPRVGDWISWTSPSANVATYTQVTAMNGSTATISTTGNVAAATGIAATVNTYASRITNKFVYDFYTDGNTIDGENGVSNTYYTNNMNPVKYRYRLASPDSIFVQVQSA